MDIGDQEAGAPPRNRELVFKSKLQLAYETGWAQNAHRFADTGISLWHSGHFFLSGKACFSKRFISVFTGSTTK